MCESHNREILHVLWFRGVLLLLSLSIKVTPIAQHQTPIAGFCELVYTEEGSYSTL